jgi:hypothetical protein
VSKLESCGNKVVFDTSGSYIYNRHTGSYTPLRREHGAYKLDLWVEDCDPSNLLTGKVVSVTEEIDSPQQQSPDTKDESVFPRLPWE